MLNGHVFIATSLDGYIARRDGTLDWLDAFQGDGDNGYSAFMARQDGIVMGRGTFDFVRNFDPWPYEKPVVVLSRSLTDADIPPAAKGKVRILCGPAQDVAAQLSDDGWRNAYVDGGQTVTRFLAAGLIRSLSIFRMPVLLGDGIPLFGPLPAEVTLEPTAAELLPSGAVRCDYRVPR